LGLIWNGVGALCIASLSIALLWRGVLWLRHRRPRRYWLRVLLLHVVLVPFSLFVVMPGFMGWFASRGLHTRGDEIGYDGPRVTADGTWLPQTRAGLRAESTGEHKVDPALVEAARAHAVHFDSLDGLPLRAFLVPASAPARGISAVLVHGLFRGGLEIDPVGAMFHELGADVLLLELRNHGESGRAPATFGLTESKDVIAAARFLRARPGHERDAIVLFGVSLGTAAVALAAPKVEGLAGLVLDAPLIELRGSAHRFLSAPAPQGKAQGKRRLGLPEPFGTLVITAGALWSGFAIDDVRPIDALRQLPATLPVLVVGGGDDERSPPEVVREAYDAIPAPAADKALWIRADSGHGEVWTDDPAGYRAHLAALLERIGEHRP
jgi:pimeloyl-ACP methyl ester carboxylesterase